MYSHTFPRSDYLQPLVDSASMTYPSCLTIPHEHYVGLEVGSTSCSTTSGCSSYGSPATYLQKNGNFLDHLDSSSSSSSSSVRRLFSSADLQHKAESSLSSESSVIIESMSKACRYSPEEKKERIERYKSKRHQRNFTKKIKYECRKTLADSRPRIRGRFARNDEKNPYDEQKLLWGNNMFSGDNWIDFLDAFSASVIP